MIHKCTGLCVIAEWVERRSSGGRRVKLEVCRQTLSRLQTRGVKASVEQMEEEKEEEEEAKFWHRKNCSIFSRPYYPRCETFFFFFLSLFKVHSCPRQWM